MGRTSRLMVEDDYELAVITGVYPTWIAWMYANINTEQQKQAAADVLYQYSQFVMVCIGEGVRPTDLRLHLMKELSGMPTTLKKEPLPTPPDPVGESSSSSSSSVRRREKSHST